MGHLLGGVSKIALPILGAALGPETFGLSALAGGALGGGLGGIAGGLINGDGIGKSLTGGALGAVGGGIANGGIGALADGLSDTALGRGVSDLYGGSLLQDGVTGVSSGFSSVGKGVSDLYNGSDLQGAYDGIKGAANSAANGISDTVKSTLNGVGLGGDAGGATALTGGSSYGAVAGGSAGDNLSGDVLADGSKTDSYLPKNFLNYGADVTPSSLTSTSSLAAGASPVAASTGSGFSSLGRIGSSLLSAGLGVNANDNAKDALLKAQQQNSALLTPFTTNTFDPSQLGNDPGYQFQLQQGTNALNNAAAARGNFYSGQALTDAANFNKGLTDTTLQSAYQRYLGTQQQQLGAAEQLAGVNNTTANAVGNAGIGNANVLSQSIASALGGSGFGNAGQSLGGTNDLAALLAQLKAKNANASIYG